MKKFRVWFKASIDVTTFDDKDLQWADENILEDVHHDLVSDGYIVDDMGVVEVDEEECE